jgi:hypothetical protein
VALATKYYDELYAQRRTIQSQIEAEYDMFAESVTLAASQ